MRADEVVDVSVERKVPGRLERGRAAAESAAHTPLCRPKFDENSRTSPNAATLQRSDASAL